MRVSVGARRGRISIWQVPPSRRRHWLADARLLDGPVEPGNDKVDDAHDTGAGGIGSRTLACWVARLKRAMTKWN